jgi:hypothetical protein
LEAIGELASLRMRQGFFEAAIAGWDLSLKMRPDLAVIHYNRANALKDSGRMNEADCSCESSTLGGGTLRRFPTAGLCANITTR